MTTNQILSSAMPEAEVRRAIRAHYQENTAMTVMNARMTLLCVSLVLAILALAGAYFRQSAVISGMRPWIVRINDVGRAERVSLANLDYVPQAPEMKAALREFAELYYSRIRSTVQDDFGKSLHFVESQKAGSILEAANREQWISGFLSQGGAEIHTRVLNVVLTETQQQPYRALVDFEKVYTQGQSEVKRERWTASFTYYVHPTKDSVQDLVNPLGVSIVDFREDKASEDK